jgi:hypothetical protein
MKVFNEIKVYEVEGDEPKNDVVLVVNSHWNYSDRVVLKFEDKHITVLASNLNKAVDNAINH